MSEESNGTAAEPKVMGAIQLVFKDNGDVDLEIEGKLKIGDLLMMLEMGRLKISAGWYAQAAMEDMKKAATGIKAAPPGFRVPLTPKEIKRG